MDVRKKLVELLQDENNPVWKWFPNNMAMLQLADYLIAHGVTVQEWIPVTERLPDVRKFVLVYDNINGVCLDYRDGDSFGYCEVTHWMPLPEKPNGE